MFPLLCSALSVGLILSLAASSSAQLQGQSYDCDDVVAGADIPICTQKITRLRQVDGCQNPCIAAAGCTTPVFYDCRECPTCKVTSTIPTWHVVKCASWQTGGGQCNATAGCPKCVPKITSCPSGGEFLPAKDQAHKAVGARKGPCL